MWTSSLVADSHKLMEHILKLINIQSEFVRSKHGKQEFLRLLSLKNIDGASQQLKVDDYYYFFFGINDSTSGNIFLY